MDRRRYTERHSRNSTPGNRRHQEDVHPRRSEERRSRSDTRRWPHSRSSSFRAGHRNRRETNRGQSQNESGSSRDPRDSLPSTSKYPVDRSSRQYNPVHHSPGSRPHDRTSVSELSKTRSQSSSSIPRHGHGNNSHQDHNRRDRNQYDQQYSGPRPNDRYPEQPTIRDHMTPRQNQRHRWRPQRFPMNRMGWPGGPARYPNFPRQNWPVFPILYSDGSTWHPPRLQPPPLPYRGPYPPHVNALPPEWMGIRQMHPGMIEGIRQITQNTVNSSLNLYLPPQPYEWHDWLPPQLPSQAPYTVPHTQQVVSFIPHLQLALSVPVQLPPPVPTPQPASSVPVQLPSPVLTPQPTPSVPIQLPSPVLAPQPASSVPVQLASPVLTPQPASSVPVQLPSPVLTPQPASSVPVQLPSPVLTPQPASSVPVQLPSPVLTPQPASSVPVQLPSPVLTPQPASSVPVQLPSPVLTPQPASSVPVQLPSPVLTPQPASSVPVQLPPPVPTPQSASSVPVLLPLPVPTQQPPTPVQTLSVVPAEAHAVSSALEEWVAAVEFQIPTLQATTTQGEGTHRDHNTTVDTNAGDATAMADTEKEGKA